MNDVLNWWVEGAVSYYGFLWCAGFWSRSLYVNEESRSVERFDVSGE